MSAAVVGDVVAVLALAALVVTSWVHPRRLVEAGVAVVTAAAVIATGLVPFGEVAEPVERLAPVVAFLVTVLVVSDVCARAGLFAAAGLALRRRAGTGERLLAATVLLAAAVTAVLSLDSTVVLLTPVAIAAATAVGTSPTPPAWACLRMANSASLLLPVSNLTNLLALPYLSAALSIGFTGFAVRMAPVLVAVVVVEYVVLRWVLRREVTAPVTPPPATATPDLRPADVRFAGAVVVLMLAGFVATSPFGVDPWWVSAAAALVLVVWGRRRGLVAWAEAAGAMHLEFAAFVLALGVVVAGIGAGFLGDAVARVVPDSGDSVLALLAVALLATALSAVLTNLSATLLLVPLVAPLGDDAVLAALLGLNVGAGLVYTGSLANLLWQRTLPREVQPSLRAFHRVSLTVTPPALLVAVGVLALTR